MIVTMAAFGWNLVYTALIAGALISIYIFQSKIVEKHENDVKKVWLVLTYVILFLLFLGALVGSLLIWDYDLGGAANNIQDWLSNIFSTSLSTIIGSVFTWFVAVMVIKISKLALHRVGLKEGPLQKRKKTIAKVTQSIITYLLYFIAVIVILALWGVDVVPALAGLGVAGIVIGLGAQKFINDLISGFFIIFEHHFDVGEIIEVSGFKGEVVDIGLKTTKIRSWKGEVKILANGDISNVTNFSRNPSIGIIDFSIAYQEDAQQAIDLLKLELPKMKDLYPDILEEPQVLGVIALADSSVNLRVIVKTVTERHYAIERAIRQKIKEIFDQNGIEIPFPQVVVHQSQE